MPIIVQPPDLSVIKKSLAGFVATAPSREVLSEAIKAYAEQMDKSFPMQLNFFLHLDKVTFNIWPTSGNKKWREYDYWVELPEPLRMDPDDDHRPSWLRPKEDALMSDYFDFS